MIIWKFVSLEIDTLSLSYVMLGWAEEVVVIVVVVGKIPLQFMRPSRSLTRNLDINDFISNKE